MKKLFVFLAMAATVVACQSVSAQFITQVVTTGGSTGDINISGAGTVLTLQSFVADGVSYGSFIGLPVNDDTPAETLWLVGTSDPGSDSTAVSDLNLGTGSLNNGSGAIVDLTGQTLDAATTIFIFGNGGGVVNVDPQTGNAIDSGGTTPPGVVNFRDANGDIIGAVSADFWFQDPGTNLIRAPNLISTDLSRSSGGNDLVGRTISGGTFTLADIVFTTGGIGDIAGFSVTNNTTDIQDVGIAFPASGVLLGDVDLSGTVDFLDIGPFIDVLSGGTFQAEADCDQSGEVNFLDIGPFIDILSGP